MELILISEKKLKIMLSPEDMKEYEIDPESADYARTETRRAFWSILDEAKHRTGFDAASERVYIQLYPSREGGCEMYVTKVGLLPKGVKSSERGMLRVAGERDLAYKFSELSSLLRVCRELCRTNFCAQSAAYTDGSAYYLFIEGIRGFSIPEGLAFVSEFGSAEEHEKLWMHALEHGREICAEDAIKTLGALA